MSRIRSTLTNEKLTGPGAQVDAQSNQKDVGTPNSVQQAADAALLSAAPALREAEEDCACLYAAIHARVLAEVTAGHAAQKEMTGAAMKRVMMHFFKSLGERMRAVKQTEEDIATAWRAHARTGNVLLRTKSDRALVRRHLSRGALSAIDKAECGDYGRVCNTVLDHPYLALAGIVAGVHLGLVVLTQTQVQSFLTGTGAGAGAGLPLLTPAGAQVLDACRAKLEAPFVAFGQKTMEVVRTGALKLDLNFGTVNCLSSTMIPKVVVEKLRILQFRQWAGLPQSYDLDFGKLHVDFRQWVLAVNQRAVSCSSYVAESRVVKGVSIASTNSFKAVSTGVSCGATYVRDLAAGGALAVQSNAKALQLQVTDGVKLVYGAQFPGRVYIVDLNAKLYRGLSPVATQVGGVLASVYAAVLSQLTRLQNALPALPAVPSLKMPLLAEKFDVSNLKLSIGGGSGSNSNSNTPPNAPSGDPTPASQISANSCSGTAESYNIVSSDSGGNLSESQNGKASGAGAPRGYNSTNDVVVIDEVEGAGRKNGGSSPGGGKKKKKNKQ